MSLPTVIAALAVALIISSIAAIAGYYLQTRLRRLEELEEKGFVSTMPETVPVPEPSPPLVIEVTPVYMEPPSIPSALLEIMVGPRTGQAFTLLGINTLIGRDPRLCDIALDDPMISKQHARIRQEGDRFYIYDLSSTNGTFVNGETVLRAELHDGDRISMGSTELQFKHLDEVLEVDWELPTNFDR